VKRYDVLISRSQRHLKWRALDRLELFLMVLCGISLAGFTTSVMLDNSDAHRRASLALAPGGDFDLLRLWHFHRRSSCDAAQ
jgi:hypothetical protein